MKFAHLGQKLVLRIEGMGLALRKRCCELGLLGGRFFELVGDDFDADFLAVLDNEDEAAFVRKPGREILPYPASLHSAFFAP